MSLRIVPMTGFGGLNLRDGPAAVGPAEAVDLMNVEFTERGAVRQRSGYKEFTVAELTNRADSMISMYFSSGTPRLIVGNGNRLTALTNGGAVTGAESTAPTASPHEFVRFGSPALTSVYIANGTDQIRRYDTVSGFSTPASLAGQTGMFIASQHPDNRLVVACESGTTAGNNMSSVNFSNPGDPEVFTSTDYVDITPGDGEAIQGIATWRELTFVFKRSKFAVFYGNSTDSNGETIFNYRMIDGAGLIGKRAVTVTEDGVYFVSQSGLYRTTGGVPEKLSGIIDPLFSTESLPIYYLSSAINWGESADTRLCAHLGRIYIAVATDTATSPNMLLVYDIKLQWWSVYSIRASCMESFKVNGHDAPPELMFGYSAAHQPSAEKHIGRHAPGISADDMEPAETGGTAIIAYWRGGWQDFGTPLNKTIRETQVYGTGIVLVLLYADYHITAGGVSETLTFAAGQVREQMLRKALPGTVFSVKFYNATINTTFSVYRLNFGLREAREIQTAVV